MPERERIPAKYKWPACGRLTFYRRKDIPLFGTSDRMFDLSDELMGWNWPHDSRTIYMGVSTKSVRWKRWSNEALEKIELLIRYDLGFDGYRVRIARLTAGSPSCSTEFLWKLQIRVAV